VIEVLFKYFIEFDDDGEIKNFHKSKNECKNCKEYLVKLIPIDRKLEDDIEKKLKQETSKIENIMKDVVTDGKKFETEFNKMVKKLKTPGRMMK